MSAINYLISLRPLTPFFFGGENTFGEETVNYHVRSNYLPQQSALLGLLRYQLLAQNQLLGTDPATANWKELIGAQSFAADPLNSAASSFGAIQQLSPLFLSNGTAHYLPQAMDWSLAKPNNDAEKEQLYPILLSFCQASTDTGTRRNQAPVLMVGPKPFDPKNGSKPLWVKSDGTEMRQWDYEKGFETGRGYENGFFIAQEQVGIHRKRKREATEKGDFYKQGFYRLIDDFAFCFYAQLDLPPEKRLTDATIQLGGERSLFAMTVTESTDDFGSRFNQQTFVAGHQRTQKAVVLVSDALATAAIANTYSFAIADSIPFRNIVTQAKHQGDYTRIRGGAIGKPSSPLYLLKRGSIFFGEDTTAIKNALANPAFEQVGYNQFIEI